MCVGPGHVKAAREQRIAGRLIGTEVEGETELTPAEGLEAAGRLGSWLGGHDAVPASYSPGYVRPP